MKFSNMVDYKGVPHYVVKTGRRNIRILLPGQAYEKSFVVPLKKVSNRRPAEYIEDPDEEEVELDEENEVLGETEELEDEQYQPQ
jgi:hypothetical protein